MTLPRMTLLRLLLALVLVAASTLGAPAARAIAQAVPTPAQTSSASPESAAAQVDKLFEKMDTTLSPGCALAAMKDGKIIYERGYGMADLDHNIPITPGTVFQVGSMSKQFTAASIVMLAQEGKLSLDDEVRKYVQEVPDFGVPITIRELVFHTSGLRDQDNLLNLAGWRVSLDLITDDDILAVMSRQKDLNFPPSSRHLYSNTGYTLLAQIVKRVSGQSLREFTTGRIFQPLGMKQTHFRDDHAEIVKNIAYGYSPSKTSFRLSVPNSDSVGAGNLLTTVEDLALWDENFYHPRVGGPAMIEQMLERGKLSNGEQLDYAFGLEVGTYRGLAIVDHGGFSGGYRSDMLRFPDQHFTAVCLCNNSSRATTNPSELTRKVAEMYLAHHMKPAETSLVGDEKTVQLSQAQLRGKVGLYLNPADNDDTRRVTLKDGKLGIDANETTALSENHFRRVNVAIDFQFEASKPDGPLRLIETRPGISKPVVVAFEAVAEFTPSAGELKDYAGIYHSEEIDPFFEMKIEESHLVLHRPKKSPDTLSPLSRDFFYGDIGTIRFKRDAKGQVIGFMVSTGRANNVRFDKRDRP